MRVATREFLLKELEMAKNMNKYKKETPDDFDHENFIKIPIHDDNGTNGKKKDPKIHIYNEAYFDNILNALLKEKKSLSALEISKLLNINYSFIETQVEALHTKAPALVRKYQQKNISKYQLSEKVLTNYLKNKGLDLELSKIERIQSNNNILNEPIPQFKTYKIIKRLEY